MKKDKKQKYSLFAGVTRKQNSDFGLVVILAVLVFSYCLEDITLLLFAILLVLITILFPVIFTPFTCLWYGFSRLLGKIMSSFLLGLIFVLVVTPVGFIRRLFGKDDLSLRKFGKSRKSVFVDRDYEYGKEDLINMF